MISTPGTFSSASGFSRIGFHLSVPGTRPSIDILALDDRWTTIKREMVTETATPTSTLQSVVRIKVKAIKPKSDHDPRLLLDQIQDRLPIERTHLQKK
jgi:hypothetical protein